MHAIQQTVLALTGMDSGGISKEDWILGSGTTGNGRNAGLSYQRIWYRAGRRAACCQGATLSVRFVKIIRITE